jgi:hypothetical protein
MTWYQDMPAKCKRCGHDYLMDHAEQLICEECDPTRGYKLCDGDDYCFELFVPSQAQRNAAQHSAKSGYRFKWICPKCATGRRY